MLDIGMDKGSSMITRRCLNAYRIHPQNWQDCHPLLPLCFVLLLLPYKCFAFGVSYAPQDLADLSLEELANLDITSVTKQESALSVTPASLYVISASDIRHSGATTLPEALRLAPNLVVSQISASSYTINAR